MGACSLAECDTCLALEGKKRVTAFGMASPAHTYSNEMKVLHPLENES